MLSVKMLTWFVFVSSVLALTSAQSWRENWTIALDEGEVRGQKYWGGDYYEFFGIPYATVPEGRDRFKGPLPPITWEETHDASEESKYIMCPQLASFDADPVEDMVIGVIDCLRVNLFIHESAKKSDTPLPVMVYFHGGAYSNGYADMVGYQNLLEHEVIAVAFNYRVGALGFLCLGTEEVPGNAGLKDQIELLKWVKKNIAKFNGNPDDVTLAGYTVGASSVEILMLTGAADGLFNKVITDSGSAMSPWAVDMDPINTAKHIAQSLGYEGGDDLEALTEFYMTQSEAALMSKSSHIWHFNSTFAFAPCIERKLDNVDSVLTESPYKILKEGRFKKYPQLTGFSNMEGISRLEKIDEWKEFMVEELSDFLPADIEIKNEDERNHVIDKILELYFEGKPVQDSGPQAYVNYFSDAMFVSSYMRSAQFYSQSDNPVYLYEFSYVGRLSTRHQFPQDVIGASHRDQTAHYLNFGLGHTSLAADLKTRARLATMWTNFARFGEPVPEPTELIEVEWTPYTIENPNYLSIGEELELLSNPLEDRMKFWNELYEKYYREPIPPKLKLKDVKTEL